MSSTYPIFDAIRNHLGQQESDTDTKVFLATSIITGSLAHPPVIHSSSSSSLYDPEPSAPKPDPPAAEQDDCFNFPMPPIEDFQPYIITPITGARLLNLAWAHERLHHAREENRVTFLDYDLAKNEEEQTLQLTLYMSASLRLSDAEVGKIAMDVFAPLVAEKWKVSGKSMPFNEKDVCTEALLAHTRLSSMNREISDEQLSDNPPIPIPADLAPIGLVRQTGGV